MKAKVTEILVARTLAVALLLFGVGACSAGESDGSSGIEASLKISGEATAQDVGLPTYPGSKTYKEPGDSSSGANIGVSTSVFGLKVAAVKLESDDRPEQVASFYHKALSKYGNVLDCNDAASGKSTGSDGLKCEATDTDGHSHVYKVGTEKNQRIVAIKPHGKGTRFDLVHVNVRD